MIFGKKICVVMPAYNAEKTLLQTVTEIPKEYIDDIILVDPPSSTHGPTNDTPCETATMVRRNVGGNDVWIMGESPFYVCGVDLV